jgi:hypothetical protein
VNQSTPRKESSRDGLPSRPRQHTVEVNAGDAIASVAASLIGFALLNIQEFHTWFQAYSDHPVSELDLIDDLTSVRETLKDMGYVWP